MKKFVLTMFGLFFFAFVCLVYGDNEKSFDKVMLNVPSKVKVIVSDGYGFRMTSNDSTYINNIRADIRNNTLYISRKKDFNPNDDVNIIILSPEPVKLYAGRNCVMDENKKADKKK